MNSADTSAHKVLVLCNPNQRPESCIELLRQLGEVRAVETIDDALKALRDERFDFVVSDVGGFLPLERATVAQRAQVVLDTIAEGVCVTDLSGRLLWANQKFVGFPPKVIERVRQMCAEAYAKYRPGEGASMGDLRSHRFSFQMDDGRYLEVNTTPILSPTGELCQISAAVYDSTSARKLQKKIDAIDNAGRELARIDAETIADLDVQQRLQLLEDKIIRYTRELMRFDNFAIRLLDKETGKLELVLCTGMPPEAQQVDLYASTEGNGISGYVAATGRSYICPDICQDRRYVSGINNARSSLTVPLRLHDKVVGILNVESDRLAAFSEDDRQFAEIFGRYVAVALNTLDLLIVERHRTTGRLASDVTSEIAGPLNDILTEATALREEYIGHDDLRHRLNAISDNVARIREAIKQVTQSPSGLVGHRDGRFQPDPKLSGKRILVADDESVIRETIHDVLTQMGCCVETARDGSEACAMVGQRPYDLILCDIKMPGLSGYEVFAAAKNANANVPVIFMTGFGYDPNHSIIRARQEGLSAVLFKPFKVDQLLAEVRGAVVPA